jgi:hypothetical protein
MGGMLNVGCGVLWKGKINGTYRKRHIITGGYIKTTQFIIYSCMPGMLMKVNHLGELAFCS